MGEIIKMRLLPGLIMVATILASSHAFASAIIDVHSHPVFRAYADNVKSHGAGMSESFPLPGYDVARHLAFMDKAGIGTALLSMPPPNPYFGDKAEARQAARDFNIQCHGLKRKYPGRFKYCAALPLPDVEGAIEEALFAFDNLEADCVKIASNSAGLYLGDARLDPLMKVLNERKAVIITHPHRPDPVNEALVKNTPLPVSEYLSETTRAIINMLSRNVPARYPDVKIIVPHCGAFLPLALPRVKALLPAMLKTGLMEPIDLDANLNGLYFDLAGTPSAEAIRQLLKITDVSHIMYGSDYPYLPAQVLLANLELLKKDLANAGDLSPLTEAILSENAASLLGMNDKKDGQ